MTILEDYRSELLEKAIANANAHNGLDSQYQLNDVQLSKKIHKFNTYCCNQNLKHMVIRRWHILDVEGVDDDQLGCVYEHR